MSRPARGLPGLPAPRTPLLSHGGRPFHPLTFGLVVAEGHHWLLSAHPSDTPAPAHTNTAASLPLHPHPPRGPAKLPSHASPPVAPPTCPPASALFWAKLPPGFTPTQVHRLLPLFLSVAEGTPRPAGCSCFRSRTQPSRGLTADQELPSTRCLILPPLATRAAAPGALGSTLPSSRQPRSWGALSRRPFLVAQLVENLPALREAWLPSLGWHNPLEKGKAAHSSIPAWRIPWTV